MVIVAVVFFLYALVATLARFDEQGDGWLQPSPRRAAPAFTALMVLGMSACAVGLPYVAPVMQGPLAVLLAVALLASVVRSVSCGAAIVCWCLPVLWLAGVGDSASAFEDSQPRPDYFSGLVVILLTGSLVLRRSQSVPPVLELPVARVIGDGEAAC